MGLSVFIYADLLGICVQMINNKYDTIHVCITPPSNGFVLC